MKKLCVILALILTLTLLPVISVSATDYTPQAETLKSLGLFLGTDKGFELERAATRAESAVMTVRLLGKDNEAKKNNYYHPFIDVPEWASPYVGYLYFHNITKGVSETQFGSTQIATAAQYATFVLRALGYDDSLGDFSWDKSLEKMVTLGILTNGQAAEFSSESGILRGNVVAISYFSLFAKLKGMNSTLIEKLYMSDKAITYEQFVAASIIDKRMSMISNYFGVCKPYPEGGVLNSEQIYEKVNAAVFKIETKILSESDFSSGSGFFITSDGIAVTNMHVITFMSSANIITADGNIHPVEGILALHPKADIAIIKIKGNNFPYLDVGNPAALRIAQRIYCVGSPYGFDNSISDGLVSSLNRYYNGYTYIQISAPIAPGSSGGALLNEYGQVVGITTAGFEQGSVNLAVPISDISTARRFNTMRSIKYLQAHSHFGFVPVVTESYTEIESFGSAPVQTMNNDTIMYGTITGADDADYYLLDAKNAAEMIISLTSDDIHSEDLKFEVTDRTGIVILSSRHYNGEAFSIATGLGASAGKYTVKVYVEDSGKDWNNVYYELYWAYHIVSEKPEKPEDWKIFFEFEPNDVSEYANYIPNYSIYLASISNRSDTDYYSFTLSRRTDYIALISTDYTRSVLNAEVFDANNKSVGRFSFSDRAELFSGTLSAGTYYIKVTAKDNSISWNNELYSIIGGPGL